MGITKKLVRPISNYMYVNMPSKYMWDCAFISEVGRVEVDRHGKAQWVSGFYRIVINRQGINVTFLRGDLDLQNEQKIIIFKNLRRLLTRSIRYKVYAAARTL